MRLKDKIAIVVGAGQSPGEGLGNGRAAVLRFAQEGAKVLAVDNNLPSAEETAAIARQAGGECIAFEADVANERTLAAMVEASRRRWGRVDVLHYNVGFERDAFSTRLSRDSGRFLGGGKIVVDGKYLCAFLGKTQNRSAAIAQALARRLTGAYYDGDLIPETHANLT